MEKRTRLPLIALTAGLISLQVGAQTNTFPSTGNAGIGSTTPQHGLLILNSENQTTLGLNSTASIRLLNQYTSSFGRRFELQFGTDGQASTNGLLGVIASEYTGFGSYVAGDLLFGTKDGNTSSVLERMRISSAGYVGIGTNAPMGKFHVVTDGNGFIIQRIAGPPSLQMQTAMGTSTAPLAVYEGNITGVILGNGFDGSEYYATGRVQFEVDGTAGANDMPGRLTFYTTPDGTTTTTERMRITNAGKVGIGTTAPSTKFHVSENLTGVYAMTLENTHTTGSGLLIKAGGAGSNTNLLTITDNAGGEILKVRGQDKTMYVRELEVRIGSFPDYVFEKNYPLMPLSELEAYINKNKHLPNVPSAKEVEENGANVGNLVKVQMEKIEELTLYLIELKKENEEIKKQLEEIKNK